MHKSSKIVPNSSEGKGNTSSSPAPKQVPPAVCWCFTLNNYTVEQEEKIQSSIKELCKLGFYNHEVGKSGTPHLQGYIEFKTKARPVNAFGIKEIHWAKAKGNKDQNFTYCTKECGENQDMTFSFGYKKKTKLKVIKTLKPWQSKCMDLIDLEYSHGDDRTINWVIDQQGGAGKTAFCKYMSTIEKQLLIITGGGYKDIACCLNLYMDNKDFDINDRTVVFFNIPRDSDDKGMISYKALESLKDGLITSTKYESKTLVFNSPVVWVFSNNEPEIDKLSQDRWKLWTIENDELSEQHTVSIKKNLRPRVFD